MLALPWTESLWGNPRNHLDDPFSFLLHQSNYTESGHGLVRGTCSITDKWKAFSPRTYSTYLSCAEPGAFPSTHRVRGGHNLDRSAVHHGVDTRGKTTIHTHTCGFQFISSAGLWTETRPQGEHTDSISRREAMINLFLSWYQINSKYQSNTRALLSYLE